jgi:predicted RNase H-like HicB family nuclease
METIQVYNVKVTEHSEGLTGQCLELPGAISEGKTLDELKANMKEAIELVLEEIHESSKSGTIAIEIIRK